MTIVGPATYNPAGEGQLHFWGPRPTGQASTALGGAFLGKWSISWPRQLLRMDQRHTIAITEISPGS